MDHCETEKAVPVQRDIPAPALIGGAGTAFSFSQQADRVQDSVEMLNAMPPKAETGGTSDKISYDVPAYNNVATSNENSTHNQGRLCNVAQERVHSILATCYRCGAVFERVVARVGRRGRLVCDQCRRKGYAEASRRCRANKAVVKAHEAVQGVPDRPCAICGSTGPIEKHHPDYNRPRLVVHLCTICHTRYHNGFVEESVARATRPPLWRVCHNPASAAECLRLRGAARLTQMKAGMLVGVHRITIWRWENGKEKATCTAAELAQRYGVRA